MAQPNLSFIGKVNMVSGASAWETFLLGAGVPESHCARLLRGSSRKGRAIRSWVRENYARKYVPEEILETLGLRRQLRLRWQADE